MGPAKKMNRMYFPSHDFPLLKTFRKSASRLKISDFGSRKSNGFELFITHSETDPTFVSSSFEHQPARTGCHSGPKTMGIPTFSIARLKCAFHGCASVISFVEPYKIKNCKKKSSHFLTFCMAKKLPKRAMPFPHHAARKGAICLFSPKV